MTSDNFTLLPGLVAVLIACVMYLAAGFKISERARASLLRVGSTSYYVSFACVAYAVVYLLQQILSGHRYDLAYVFSNSGPHDSLLYRVSALWAGQEGSLLLWAALGALIGLAFVRAKSKAPSFFVSFWCSVQAFFLVMLVVDDPFKRLMSFQPGLVGGGLNPLLKNAWMAIHPPVIFLGYALLTVPAAFAVQALVEGDSARWAKQCTRWALAGWCALTLGLVLGMIWSYEVLGWGGFWGWDPVENASFVPWLVSTALIHGLVLQQRLSRMSRANMGLALATFLAVIYATFLTRSGWLAESSVHSFTDTKGYGWLLGFMIFFTVLCVGLFLVRLWAISGRKQPLGPWSKDFVVAAGVIVLGMFAGLVVLGVSETTYGKTALKPSFYTHMSIPCALAIMALVALAPLVKWGSGERRASPSRGASNLVTVLVVVGVVALVGAFVAAWNPHGTARALRWLVCPDPRTIRLATPAMLLLFSSALIALVVSVAYVFKVSFMRCGAYVAHAGAALLIIGVVLSCRGDSQMRALPQDGPGQRLAGWQVSYLGSALSVSRGKDWFAVPLSGERRPYIRSFALSDLYISPTDIEATTLTPAMSITEQGVTSEPIRIPDSDATLTLMGMAVEAQMVKLEFATPHSQPIDLMLGKNRSAQVDGYQFTFRRLVDLDSGKHSMGAAGVEVAVTGHNLTQRAIISVSTKPFIRFVWISAVLIILGGLIATARRWRERVKQTDGILSDTD